MKWNIKIHGDFLERENYDFIHDTIPFYSMIWELYIGNDGTNHLGKIDNISIEDNHIRRRIAIHNYTCFESILLIKSIIESGTLVTDYKSYLNLLNYHMSFQSNMGRIRDNIIKINELIKLPSNIKSDFEKFWQHRNNTLHKFKLPYGFIVDEFITIVPDDDTLDKLYKSKYDDASNAHFVLLIDYYNKSFVDLLMKYNGYLGSLYSKINILMKSNHYILTDPPIVNLHSDHKNGELVGTTFVDFNDLFKNK